MSSKVRFSTQLPEDVHRRVYATLRGLKRIDPDFTLSSFTATALNDWCQAMEHLHNGGQRWPADDESGSALKTPTRDALIDVAGDYTAP